MRLTDDDRRRRLVRRHHLARTADNPVAVVESLSTLHSSDPLTPYLACWARIPGFKLEDLERSLYDDRTLLRLHSMRRTLFVVLTSDAPVFEAGAARAIARKERARLFDWLGEVMGTAGVDDWLEAVSSRVLDELSGEDLSTKELTGRMTELALTLRVGSGRWVTEVGVASRLLYLMAMEMAVVRGRPLGTWRSSQYRWARAEEWLGLEPKRLEEAEGRVALARRYLATHGPATMTDLRWWTGWTVADAKEALASLDLTTVELDSGVAGLVLDGDESPEEGEAGSASLLPSLDPTIMGWKERDWYLGPHGSELFDSAGNAGPTVWAAGRVIGGWGQGPRGDVVYGFVEDVDRATKSAVAVEAARLTDWLDGVVVMPRFPSPFGRRLAKS